MTSTRREFMWAGLALAAAPPAQVAFLRNRLLKSV
jgi:hypothetical protein